MSSESSPAIAVATLYQKNLVTRQTGRAVRDGIERLISGRSEAIAVIDFQDVAVIDFSCADEVVAKLLLRLEEASGEELKHPNPAGDAVRSQLGHKGGGNIGDDIVHGRWGVADTGVGSNTKDFVTVGINWVYFPLEVQLPQPPYVAIAHVRWVAACSHHSYRPGMEDTFQVRSFLDSSTLQILTLSRLAIQGSCR